METQGGQPRARGGGWRPLAPTASTASKEQEYMGGYPRMHFPGDEFTAGIEVGNPCCPRGRGPESNSRRLGVEDSGKPGRSAHSVCRSDWPRLPCRAALGIAHLFVSRPRPCNGAGLRSGRRFRSRHVGTASLTDSGPARVDGSRWVRRLGAGAAVEEMATIRRQPRRVPRRPCLAPSTSCTRRRASGGATQTRERARGGRARTDGAGFRRSWKAVARRRRRA